MTTTAKKATTPKAADKAATEAPAEAPTHDSLAHALAAFQADMPTVHKGQTARIPGKDGRAGYSYQYADLADVAKVAHPLLARHGLSFTTAPQHLDGVGFVLQGTLRHTSGQEDTGVLPITGRSAQDLGSSLTYLRRYLLGCMTGIVTDEDEDGTAATDAGTQRPQAETPPAYQSAPAMGPEATALHQDLSVLSPEQQQEVRDWWAANNVPPLAGMGPDMVAQVRDAWKHYLDPSEAR